jgi:predicted extracellular nuclease
MSQSRSGFRPSWLLGIALVAGPLAPQHARAVSPDIVISQVYGGGGNAGATYTHDFIELFNRGPIPVSIDGWSVQYSAVTGTSWTNKTSLSGTIPAGGYFLIQEAAGTGGSQPLPTSDLNPPGSIAISGTNGKAALVNNNTTIPAMACPGAAQGVVDFLGFGPSANCSETGPTPLLSNATAAIRNGSGCTDTDNNASDFNVNGAPTPRNSASPLGSCGETGPSVTSSIPSAGATGVATTTPVSVTFNESVSVAAGAVTLECPLGSQIAANVAANNVTSVSLTPGTLPAGVSCVLRVSAAGVSDSDLSDPPDTLSADFSASFSTSNGVACGAVDTPIGQIQGSGTTAALTGTRTVQGVVVADYEFPGSGTNTDYLRGFYLQNPIGSDDGDANTSDALFIFNSNNDSVSVGQVVQVTGNVSDFAFGSTGGTQTQITASSVEICSTSASIAPVDVTFPVASATALERYEGMLVRLPQTLFVTEHFQLGRFGQVLLSAGGRLQQPTEIVAPGAAALAQQATNELNQILLDDDVQIQNPDPIRFGRGSAALSASNTLRGGDTINGVVGVLTQTDATTAANVPATSDPVAYRVRPFNVLNQVTPSFSAINPRPGATAQVSGALKVAGFNLLNYFKTVGVAGQANCHAGVNGAALDCRGGENSAEFERQWPKTVAAILSLNADIIVINELQNDGYDATSSLQDLVSKLNAASTPGNFAFIDVDARTGQVNAMGSDAIRVAMLYRTSKVNPVGQTAVANTGAYGVYQTGAGAFQRNRPALAQAFESLTCGARLVVVGNHLKSKGSSCSDNISPVGPDVDLGDGQGECNLTRKAAATQLVSWLQGDPTGSGTDRILLLGDYNAYAKEDPIGTLVSGGYTDLVPWWHPSGAYSYVFDGQWGSLDHALGSLGLRKYVTDVFEWHVNADEPGVLDYNTNFKSAGQLSSLYAADRFRASDHDAIIVGLSLPCSGAAPVPALGSLAGAALVLMLLALGALLIRRAPRRA